MIRGYDTTFSLPPLFIPNGSEVFSFNHSLLRNEIRYILSSGSVTIATVPPPLPLSLNLLLGLYIYNRGLFPCVQNHVPDDIEIYEFRRALIESYAPQFADG